MNTIQDLENTYNKIFDEIYNLIENYYNTFWEFPPIDDKKAKILSLNKDPYGITLEINPGTTTQILVITRDQCNLKSYEKDIRSLYTYFNGFRNYINNLNGSYKKIDSLINMLNQIILY